MMQTLDDDTELRTVTVSEQLLHVLPGVFGVMLQLLNPFVADLFLFNLVFDFINTVTERLSCTCVDRGGYCQPAVDLCLGWVVEEGVSDVIRSYLPYVVSIEQSKHQMVSDHLWNTCIVAFIQKIKQILHKSRPLPISGFDSMEKQIHEDVTQPLG